MMHIVEVKIQNNITRKTVTVPSNTTLRTIFEENDMEYNSGVVSLDGASLPVGSMDKTLDELGITGDRCYLMVSVKADNAADEESCPACEATPCVCAAPAAEVAKIKIIGNTVHIVSSQKLEDVKLLAKYRPNALKLTEGSGSEKKEIFAVMTGGDKGGYIGKNGIIFSNATTSDGHALVTLTAPDGTENMKDWAEEEIGVAILLLKKVEAQFAAAIEEVKAEKAAVAASITVA